MAIAFKWDGEVADGEPSGVHLLRTDDKDGILFVPELFLEGEEKLRKFMDAEGGARFNERESALGFLHQTTPDQGR